MKDTEDTEDGSFGEEDDYSSIFNPSIAKNHFTRICANTLNNCQVPSYMPNYKMAARGGKTDNSFSRNLMGLLIWKLMTGKLWVKTTTLCLTKNTGCRIFPGIQRLYEERGTRSP